MHGQFPYTTSQEKVQPKLLQKLLKKRKENLIKSGLIEVKNFIIKHFCTS